MGVKVKLTSRREECIDILRYGINAALEVVGSKVAGYALLLAPVDTGRLKNSITWATEKTEGRGYSYEDDNGKKYDDKVGVGVPKGGVAVGTNVEYAVYQENGTSKTKAHPFLKPAVERHIEEYKEIIKTYLKNA